MHNTFFKQTQRFLVRNSGRFSVATTSTIIFANGLRSWSKERYGLLITLLRISMNNHVFRLLLILVGHTAKNWPTVKTYQWKPIDVINNSVFCSLSTLSSFCVLHLIVLLVSLPCSIAIKMGGHLRVTNFANKHHLSVRVFTLIHRSTEKYIFCRNK